MRVVLTVLGLLVALAVVATLAKRQLEAVRAAPAAAAGTAPTEAPGQLPRRVGDDVGRLLQQGASRAGGAEQ